MRRVELEVLKDMADIIEILASGHRDQSTYNEALNISKRVRKLKHDDPVEYDYIFDSDKTETLLEFKGKKCRVLESFNAELVRVELEDQSVKVTYKGAIRKIKKGEKNDT